MRSHHAEGIFPRRLEAEFPAAADLIKTDRRERSNEGETREKREEQRQGIADHEPNAGDGINETEENEMRGHRREIGKTFHQGLL